MTPSATAGGQPGRCTLRLLQHRRRTGRRLMGFKEDAGPYSSDGCQETTSGAPCPTRCGRRRSSVCACLTWYVSVAACASRRAPKSKLGDRALALRHPGPRVACTPECATATSTPSCEPTSEPSRPRRACQRSSPRKLLSNSGRGFARVCTVALSDRVRRGPPANPTSWRIAARAATD